MFKRAILVAGVSLLMCGACFADSPAANSLPTKPPEPPKPITIDPRVMEMYQSANRAIIENESTNWQKAYVTSLNQLNEDWKKSFEDWCGKRPACGLPPKETEQK